MTEREKQLQEAFEEYAQHYAWRCQYPDRYPWDDDCCCGLIRTATSLGLDEFVREQRRWAETVDSKT